MHKHIIGIVTGLVALWTSSCPLSAQTTAGPYPTKRVALSYPSADREIPALLIAPATKGTYPVVLYVHGRSGLNESTAAYLETIAERGVVILAPDYYFARGMPALAPFHDPETQADVEAAVPFLTTIAGQYTTLDKSRFGVLGQDHGAYFSLLLGAGTQDKFGALIGIYPLLQDPNINKIQHLYAFSRAVEDLQIPTLLLIGKSDREMRRLQVERVASRLEALKREVRLVEYPGAQRCFDWRTNQASLANAMARSDSANQIVRHLKTVIGGEKLLVMGTHGWETL